MEPQFYNIRNDEKLQKGKPNGVIIVRRHDYRDRGRLYEEEGR